MLDLPTALQGRDDGVSDVLFPAVLCVSDGCALVFSADGYISNTCVDIDYEAVKRALFQCRIDPLQLPPPPPDPPQASVMEFHTRDRYHTR